MFQFMTPLTLSVLDVNSSDPCLFPGQHRFLGPGISKVRSMKLDSSIWTNELIEVQIFRGSFFYIFYHAIYFPDFMFLFLAVFRGWE